MKKRAVRKVMDDVAMCSACVLVNTIPEISKLPMPEALERLKLSFLAALEAFRFNSRRVRRIPKPSRN